jgi:hypothetical protein
LWVRQRQPLQLILVQWNFFLTLNKRCLSKNKSGNLICRGVLNFSELFELTLTDPQLAPPSGESCFSMNNYFFIVVPVRKPEDLAHYCLVSLMWMKIGSNDITAQVPGVS